MPVNIYQEVNGIRPLCPTHWTVRTGAVDVVIKSYATILDTLEEVHCTTHGILFKQCSHLDF